jgi:hypothetical protein
MRVHNGNSEHQLARSITTQMPICNANIENFYFRCIFATTRTWVKFWENLFRAPQFLEMHMRLKPS